MAKEYEVTQTDADIFDRLLVEACTERLERERRDLNFWDRAVKAAREDGHRKYAQARLEQAAERMAHGMHREAIHITSTVVLCEDASCGRHRALFVGVA